MKAEQELVRDFHNAGHQAAPQKPTLPVHQVSCLRATLILEEWQELCDALGVKHIDEQVFDWETSPCEAPDLVKASDAIGDLLYVVLGTAVACGIDIEPIFHEIHRSNMSKFIDGTFREDGKYLKGPGYSPPNLKQILDSQA